MNIVNEKDERHLSDSVDVSPETDSGGNPVINYTYIQATPETESEPPDNRLTYLGFTALGAIIGFFAKGAWDRYHTKNARRDIKAIPHDAATIGFTADI